MIIEARIYMFRNDDDLENDVCATCFGKMQVAYTDFPDEYGSLLIHVNLEDNWMYKEEILEKYNKAFDYLASLINKDFGFCAEKHPDWDWNFDFNVHNGPTFRCLSSDEFSSEYL